MRPSKRWLSLSRRDGNYQRWTESLQKSEMPSDVLVLDSEHI
jgi:hypothetical protein